MNNLCDSIYCITVFQIIGVLVAFATVTIALYQYYNERRFKKAAYFMELRKKFKENEDFKKIRKKIKNNENIDDFDDIEIFDYIGFFEELQIAINSKFVKPEMVYYLFGYYIIPVYEMKIINSNAPLWSAFNELAKKMISIKERNITSYGNLKF